MIGETLSHYEIVGKIGAGGMGEVYRARDPRLGREVAVKVLPEAFAQRPERLARFEQEARAVGALQHPNILAVHDVGNARGVPYIVTELLDGEPLRERIRSGNLTTRKALELAAQVADGLAAAHARNIVHRDLKPENVFITRDGRAKILDFGLAKLSERDPENPVSTESPTAALTDSNVAVGTAGYMAPEQLQGGRVDPRSDIFAFGVLLFEMLSGRKPFVGDSYAEVSASILRDEPRRLSNTGQPVPPTVERLVLQCLEKNPNERFESAHDLAHILRAVSSSGEAPVVTVETRPRRRWIWAAAAATAVIVGAAAVVWQQRGGLSPPTLPEIRHIAVLPFEAAGGSPDDRFLAAGLAETIADGLEIIEAETRGATWVVPPSPDLSLEEANLEDNVTLGLKGRFESGAELVRLRLELVDAATGRRLDSRTVEESVRNLGSLQRQPVLAAWDLVGYQPSPTALEALERLCTNTFRACRFYVEGRGRLASAGDEAALEAAAVSLGDAVEDDPAYVPARLALARAFTRLFEATGMEGWQERALAEAEHAVALDNASAEAYLVLGDVHAAASDEIASLDAYREAAARARTAKAHIALGEATTDAGLFDEAEAALQAAINLRPDDARGHEQLAYLYYLMERPEAAANQYRQAARCAPGRGAVHRNLGTILYVLGRRDEAMAAFEDALAIEPDLVAYSNLGTLHFEAGRYGDAAEAFGQAVDLCDDETLDEHYYLVGNLASARYWGGERELAVEGFERSVSLVERHLEEKGRSLGALVDLAAYLGMLGRPERGREVIESAVELEPKMPSEFGAIAEAYTDLGDDERALAWVASALEAGLDPEWFKRRPSFNRLRGEPAFQDVTRRTSEPG
jgi:serine/threonine-protein kinase